MNGELWPWLLFPLIWAAGLVLAEFTEYGFRKIKKRKMQRIFTFHGHKHIDLDSILEISVLQKETHGIRFFITYMLKDQLSEFRAENGIVTRYYNGFAGKWWEEIGIPENPNIESSDIVVSMITDHYKKEVEPIFEKSYNELLAAWKERVNEMARRNPKNIDGDFLNHDPICRCGHKRSQHEYEIAGFCHIADCPCRKYKSQFVKFP